MKFSDYELKDFIKDESFQNWVKKTDPDDVLQWDLWLANNESKRPLANEAATIIRGITFNRQQVSRQKIDAGWQRLTRHIAQTENADLSVKLVKWHQRRQVRQMAAVWLGFLFVTAVGFYFYQKTRELRYQTGFGETATIILPDKSTVVLNSNSKLVLANNWSSLKDREVWLEGEAFFSVVKKTGRGDARFLVHTGNMVVKVLGTKFNVNSRKSRTRVVLNSGKVQLKAGKTDAGNSTIMQPGELAELTADKKGFVKKKVNPWLYSSWIHKKLIFDDTSIQEIAGMLEDNYGFRVKLADSTLMDRKLTGEVYVEDVETLLTALSKSFQLEMIQNGNTLIIKGT
ncbi:MAG: FecR domain-containing protein [Bacteroidota bacterium]|nr:FecR domain-containing protein [Bacteroidota bacterium]